MRYALWHVLTYGTTIEPHEFALMLGLLATVWAALYACNRFVSTNPGSAPSRTRKSP